MAIFRRKRNVIQTENESAGTSEQVQTELDFETKVETVENKTETSDQAETAINTAAPVNSESPDVQENGSTVSLPLEAEPTTPIIATPTQADPAKELLLERREHRRKKIRVELIKENTDASNGNGTELIENEETNLIGDKEPGTTAEAAIEVLSPQIGEANRKSKPFERKKHTSSVASSSGEGGGGSILKTSVRLWL